MTPARVLGPAAIVVTLLAACSGGSDDPGAGATPTATVTETSTAPAGSASPSAVVSATPYLPVPDGVELTEQGSELDVGDPATVAWEPRRRVVGALEITVTRLERASLQALSAFRLDPTQRRSTPFYVRATVRNRGRTNLAGVSVPLYLLDGRDTLIQATPFAATFRPCPSQPLPRPFRTGARTRACLVFLVPEQGRLEAVSFRPTQEYDPIIWTGPVRPAGGRG